MDSPPEPLLDQLATLAARACEAPLSLISVLDEHHQWFKARVGLDVCRTERDVAFCDHVVRSRAPLIVEDTHTDERFRDNPLVVGDPNVRFYVGFPLHVSGAVVGSVCVLDRRPRQLTEAQLESLEMVRDQVQAQLVLREVTRDLAQARERFDQLTRHIPQVFWIMCPDGSFDYVSPVVERFWGISASEVLVRPELVFESIHPEDRDRVRAAASSWEKMRRFDQTYRLQNLEGYRWVRTRAFPSPLSPRDGRDRPIAGLTADVTDQVARSEELEEAVAERTDQLRQAQKMEAAGSLACGVAHDFNELLTVVLSYAQMIREDLGPEAPSLEDLDQIDLALSRATSLTQQLLLFGRRSIARPQDLELRGQIEVIARMIERQIDSDIRLDLDLAGAPAWARIDPGRFQQVLMNLLLNARDAMPQGGRIQVELSTHELADAQVPSLGEGVYHRMRVRDTGVGMSAETRRQLFAPFFTTKSSGRGTGLGLSTTLGIVTEAGGVVEVDSQPERGATFTVWLPTRRAPEAPDPALTQPSASLEEPPRRALRVLAVEDDGLSRGMLQRVLEGRGHQVWAVRNSMEALLYLEAHANQCDLVLAELELPYMGGVELAQRAQGVHPHLQFLFISDHVGGSAALAGRGLAEHPVLRKPFGARELIEALEGLTGE